MFIETLQYLPIDQDPIVLLLTEATLLIMMHDKLSEYIESDYICTTSGNRISRKSTVVNAKALEVPSGRVTILHGVTLRSDLAKILINKYTYINENTIIRPPYQIIMKESANDVNPVSLKFIPLTIGSHTYIGKNCVVEAAVIGLGVYIEDDVIISKRCVLKDFVLIKKGSVIPPDMVIPPMVIVEGNPASIIGERCESITTTAINDAVLLYKSFIKK